MRVRLSAFGGFFESKVLTFPDETPDKITITLPLRYSKWIDRVLEEKVVLSKCTFEHYASVGNAEGTIEQYFLTDIENTKEG